MFLNFYTEVTDNTRETEKLNTKKTITKGLKPMLNVWAMDGEW